MEKSKFFLPFLQVVWESQKKRAKSAKTAKTSREEINEQQAADTRRIYEAIEKIAKVSISNKL